MTESKTYSYEASVKSNVSDELINTYLIRPLAGLFVRVLFSTSITPNHVTVASTLVGFLAAFFYLEGAAVHNIIAGFCITLKDILDSADGQLARAKQQYSRIGRFLDSIGDFFVNAFAFSAITYALFLSSQSAFTIVLGLFGFLGITLRVSYHVFYQTSYLHLQDAYNINRVTEEIREQDLQTGTFTLRLQHVFQLLYGWQDQLMLTIDAWCRSGAMRNDENRIRWYGDRVGLKFSGLLGLGTELFVVMLFSVTNQLERYLLFNLIIMNGVWFASIFYRKGLLASKLSSANRHDRS